MGGSSHKRRQQRSDLYRGEELARLKAWFDAWSGAVITLMAGEKEGITGRVLSLGGATCDEVRLRNSTGEYSPLSDETSESMEDDGELLMADALPAEQKIKKQTSQRRIFISSGIIQYKDKWKSNLQNNVPKYYGIKAQ